MEGFLYLIAGHFGVGETPLHKPYPYSLIIGEYLHLRYIPEMFGDVFVFSIFFGSV